MKFLKTKKIYKDIFVPRYFDTKDKKNESINNHKQCQNLK